MEGFWPNLYLPSELWFNILTRLPANSLLRCTSVCRSWYSFITSPHFINAHVQCQNDLKGNHILVYGPDKYSVHTDDEEFSKLFQVDNIPIAEAKIVDSCNGLVCLCVKKDEKDTLYLWNPCVRKILQIPPTERWTVAGFGCSSATNDYKIVTLATRPSQALARVYELRTGAWRVIPDTKQFLTQYGVIPKTAQMFFNDKFYWVGHNRYCKRVHRVIVTFDAIKDEFGVFELPPEIQTHYRLILFSSGCLTLFSSLRTLECGIWVMNDGDGCWTKTFAGFLSHNSLFVPVAFSQNGDALIIRDRDCRMRYLFSCDLKTKKMKDTGVSRAGHFYATKLVPSLLLLHNPPFDVARL